MLRYHCIFCYTPAGLASSLFSGNLIYKLSSYLHEVQGSSSKCTAMFCSQLSCSYLTSSLICLSFPSCRSQRGHYRRGGGRAVVRHRRRQRRRLDASAQERGRGGIRPHVLRWGLFGNKCQRCYDIHLTQKVCFCFVTVSQYVSIHCYTSGAS